MSYSKNHLLIVEDEEAIGEGLLYNFEAEGFVVTLISDGEQALTYIQEHHPKLCTIVLDLMLPGLDGHEILSRTRHIAERVPILILTAKSTEDEKIKAFELGADDFVTKPFSLSELILRLIRLVQRRTWYGDEAGGNAQGEGVSSRLTPVAFGQAEFYPQTLILKKPDGSEVRMSPTEGLLIQVFLEHKNVIVSRQELLKKVWHYDGLIETRTVDVFVAKLRKHIEKKPDKPTYLVSVRGAGYRYCCEE